MRAFLQITTFSIYGGSDFIGFLQIFCVIFVLFVTVSYTLAQWYSVENRVVDAFLFFYCFINLKGSYFLSISLKVSKIMRLAELLRCNFLMFWLSLLPCFDLLGIISIWWLRLVIRNTVMPKCICSQFALHNNIMFNISMWQLGHKEWT